MKPTAATQYSLGVPKATSVAGNPILGTRKLQSLVFEATETGQRSSPFGDHPVGYLSYSPDGGNISRLAYAKGLCLLHQSAIAGSHVIR